MSEYADINTKKLSLFEFRNYVNSCIVSLFFSRRDLIVTPNCKVDPEDVDSDEYKPVSYTHHLNLPDWAREKLEKLQNTGPEEEQTGGINLN